MKKIMFNDRYGLTQAVIDGRKTMTRRIIKGLPDVHELRINYGVCTLRYTADASRFVTSSVQPRYKIGEEVAVAQSYAEVVWRTNPYTTIPDLSANGELQKSKGWTNKMFVKADLMPHRIRITDIKVERLQECSDDDMLKEGILQSVDGMDLYTFDGWVKHCKGHNLPIQIYTKNIREAFAALIDKVSGKGTWESNPWVFVYKFELLEGGEQ